MAALLDHPAAAHHYISYALTAVIAEDPARKRCRRIGKRAVGMARIQHDQIGALSARETRDWPFKARRAVTPEKAYAYIQLVTRIMMILTAIIPREREMPNARARRKKRTRRDGSTSESEGAPNA